MKMDNNQYEQIALISKDTLKTVTEFPQLLKDATNGIWRFSQCILRCAMVHQSS